MLFFADLVVQLFCILFIVSWIKDGEQFQKGGTLTKLFGLDSAVVHFIPFAILIEFIFRAVNYFSPSAFAVNVILALTYTQATMVLVWLYGEIQKGSHKVWGTKLKEWAEKEEK